MRLHDAPNPPAPVEEEDEDEEETNEFACPNCGSMEFRQDTWGTFTQAHYIDLDGNGNVDYDDWGDDNQDRDGSDPWCCKHCEFELPQDLQDHLNEVW